MNLWYVTPKLKFMGFPKYTPEWMFFNGNEPKTSRRGQINPWSPNKNLDLHLLTDKGFI